MELSSTTRKKHHAIDALGQQLVNNCLKSRGFRWSCPQKVRKTSRNRRAGADSVKFFSAKRDDEASRRLVGWELGWLGWLALLGAGLAGLAGLS